MAIADELNTLIETKKQMKNVMDAEGDVFRQYVDDLEENKEDINNAIREKNGATDVYKLREMPNAIRELPSVEEYQDLVENSFTNDFEGSEGFIEDTAKARVIDMNVKGDIKQDSYEGYNILNPETRNTRSNGVTISYDNETQIITLNGTCTANNTTFKFINEEDINEKVLPANATGYLLIKYISGSSTGLLNVVAYDSAFSQNILARAENGVTQDILATSKASIEKSFIKYRIRMDEGSSFDNLKIKVMLSFDKPEYEPYVGGTASPNINYPQEIKVVNGNYDVSVGNKNKSDISDLVNRLAYVSDGSTRIWENYCAITKYYEVLPNTNYVISNNLNLPFQRVIEYDKNFNFINGNVINKTTFITNENTKYIRFNIQSDLSNIDWLQIEKNIEPTPYTPHEEKTYSLDMRNRNKLNIENVILRIGTIISEINENSISFLNINPNTNCAVAYNIPVEVGKTICINVESIESTISSTNNRIQYYFTDEPVTNIETLQGTVIAQGTKYTFVETEKTNLVVILRGGNNLTVTYNKLQVYYGDQELSYVPYTEPYKYTAYKDAYFRRKGYKDFELVNLWGEVVFDGSENWSKSSTKNIDRFYLTMSDKRASLTPVNLLYSNYFTSINRIDAYRVGTLFEGSANNNPAIFVDFTKYGTTTLEQFKQWLAEKQPKVQYILKESSITPITNDILNSQLEEISKIKMYEGGTNIIITGEEALPILNPNYIVSKNYIQSAMLLAEPEIGG